MQSYLKTMIFGFIMLIALIPKFTLSSADDTYSTRLTSMLERYPSEEKVLEINTTTNAVEVNGKCTTLQREFDISTVESSYILNHADTELQEYGYELTSSKNGTDTYENKFENRRLVVKSFVSNNYGAIDAVKKNDTFYILQYATPEETAIAYYAMIEDGVDVIIDETIENALSYYPGDETSLGYSVAQMGLDDLQENTDYQKNTVIVATIDSGITPSVIGESRVIDNVNLTEDEGDEIGHGTRVNNIIADATSDNIKIMSIKAFDNTGSTSFLTVEAALQYAISNNANVINMSLGLDSDENQLIYNEWNESIDEAIAKGIPVIVAAGNKGHSTDYCYPAYYEPVWTIGSVDQDNTVSTFSNYGNVDFVAYGKNIDVLNTDGSHVYMNGTSVSTPHITALVAQLRGGMTYQNVEEQYNQITTMCIDLGDTGVDSYYGNGLPVYASKTTACETHDLEIIEEQDATCEMPGYILYQCKNCTYTEKEDVEAAHTPVAMSLPSTCTTDGSYIEYCDVCKITLNTETYKATGHAWEKTTIAPTETTNGTQYEKCENCNAIQNKIDIPATKTEIVRVVDGDTIVVKVNDKEYKVRMIGVNTPESVSADESKNCEEGNIASKYTSSLLTTGSTVYLEYDEDYYDVYNRVLAYVWTTNTYTDSYNDFCKYNVGAILLQNTYCESVYYAPNGKYKLWYDLLEKQYQPFKEDSNSTNTSAPTTEEGTEESTTEVNGSENTTEKEEQSTEKTEVSDNTKQEQVTSTINKAKRLKTKLIAVKNVRGKKIQIKVKKYTGYKYQYQISTTKRFKVRNSTTYKSSKNGYTVKKCARKKLKKGKTYYIRVRTYKKINGKIYYGKWSTIKKVKVKK